MWLWRFVSDEEEEKPKRERLVYTESEEEKPKRERLVYTESEEEKPKKKQKSQGQKVQRYLFTWNNPTLSGDEFADFLKDIDAVTGFVFQLEEGENGTPHFQGWRGLGSYDIL